MIKIKCYNQTTVHDESERARLIKIYKEYAMSTDGLESERYSNIYWALEAGKNDIVDLEW